MIEAAVDSTTINDLLRTIPRTNETLQTSLDPHIKSGRFRVAVDSQLGIVDEWRKTCREETVNALVIRWQDMNGMRAVKGGSIRWATMKRMKAAGFKDKTIDKLLLRIAVQSHSQSLVSRDPDFWDPLDRHRYPIGNPLGAVARICRDELNVTVLTLDILMSQLRGG